MDDKIQNTKPVSQEGGDINLIDYLFVLLKWKRFIIVNVLLFAILIAGITLLIPNRFRSIATLLPPKQRGGMTSSLSQLARDFLPSNALGRLGASSQESYNYLAILQSYTAMERLITKFNLGEVYEVKPRNSIEKTIKAAKDYLDFKIEDEGTITITVWDKDPQRAADMANYLVELLNEISIKLGTKEATDNRIFVEKRYTKVLQDLKMSEDSLKLFQRKYGIYSIQEALSGKFLSSFVPFEKVPELTMQYLRLYRNLEIQNKILEFALPMYEQARVDEQKEVPVVLVLDKAVPGERKDTPKRSLIVLSASILALILNVLLVLFLEALHSRQTRTSFVKTHRVPLSEKIAKFYHVPL